MFMEKQKNQRLPTEQNASKLAQLQLRIFLFYIVQFIVLMFLSTTTEYEYRAFFGNLLLSLSFLSMLAFVIIAFVRQKNNDFDSSAGGSYSPPNFTPFSHEIPRPTQINSITTNPSYAGLGNNIFTKR